MKLDELLHKGIRTQDDGRFLRSAGMTIVEDTFEILRAYALYSQCHRLVWVAGAKVRQRFLNREFLGTPKEFEAVRSTNPRIFGKLRYQEVHCYSDVEPSKWNDDTLIAIGLDRDDNVIEYAGVRIDMDREEACKTRSMA
jgi:hypothetical protein